MEYFELGWRDRGRLWLRLLIRLALTVLVLLVLFLLGPPLLSLLAPFVVAIIFTWILNPLVRWIEKRSILSRKVTSILLILVICSALGGLLAWFLYRMGIEISTLMRDWANIWGGVLATFQQVYDLSSRYFNYLPPAARDVVINLSNRILIWLQNIGSSMIPRTTSWAMEIPSFALSTVFALMATYFLTADYPHIRSIVTEQLPKNVRNFGALVKNTFNAAFGGYLKAELILTVGVFFILGVGLALIHQSYAILIAFLLAVLDFIPIIGSGTVLVPWAVICFALGDWRKGSALLIIWGMVCIFRRLAEPKALGSQTGLHPVLSLLSIFVGMRTFGVLGMVFGPAVLLVIINICRSGVLRGVMDDLSLAAHDISALLKNRSHK